MVDEPQDEPPLPSAPETFGVCVRNWGGEATAQTAMRPYCGGHHVDTTAEKRKAASRRPSHNALISLRKFGAGEGIRTLDPNLGKDVSRLTSSRGAANQPD
jgi:hypothetical protein